MRHFCLINAPTGRHERFLLITNNGEEFIPFSVTMKNMVRQGYAYNTIEQYSGHIARFIDYIYEASNHTTTVTPDFILDVVYSYKAYLLFGKEAEDSIARKIAIVLDRKHTSNPSSLIPIGAAIKYFLTLSDAVSLLNKQDSLFNNLSLAEKKKLNPREKVAIKQNSMLAGVLRGGVQFTKRSSDLFGLNDNSNISEFKVKALPFDKVGKLINSANSFRDKSFYCLLAASGCRQHEALQLQFCDIDTTDQLVRLIDPKTRSVKGVSQSEYERLSWKGRATSQTFLIEPFKTLFFEYLVKYLRHERINHGKHDFIFQDDSGAPYYLSARQTRSGAFKSHLKKIGLDTKMGFRIHSLRHMYGVYTLNYLPLENRFGLPMPLVKVLMGHASIASTECYAKYDHEHIHSQIEYANQMIFGAGETKTLDEIKVLYHKSEIDRLERLETSKSDMEGKND